MGGKKEVTERRKWKNRSPFEATTRVNIKRPAFTYPEGERFSAQDVEERVQREITGRKTTGFEDAMPLLRASIQRLYNPIYGTNSRPATISAYFPPRAHPLFPSLFFHPAFLRVS